MSEIDTVLGSNATKAKQFYDFAKKEFATENIDCFLGIMELKGEKTAIKPEIASEKARLVYYLAMQLAKAVPPGVSAQTAASVQKSIPTDKPLLDVGVPQHAALMSLRESLKLQFELYCAATLALGLKVEPPKFEGRPLAASIEQIFVNKAGPREVNLADKLERDPFKKTVLEFLNGGKLDTATLGQVQKALTTNMADTWGRAFSLKK